MYYRAVKSVTQAGQGPRAMTTPRHERGGRVPHPVARARPRGGSGGDGDPRIESAARGSDSSDLCVSAARRGTHPALAVSRLRTLCGAACWVHALSAVPVAAARGLPRASLVAVLTTSAIFF